MLGLKKHLDLKVRKITPWRKVSLGSWRPMGESSIYSQLEVDVEKIEALLRDQKIQLSTLVIQALAKALFENPEINALVRWGRVYQRNSCDVFFHMIQDHEGEELTGHVFYNAHIKSLSELEAEFKSAKNLIKHQGESAYEESKKIFSFLPSIFSRLVLDLTSFILFKCNLWLPLLKTPQNPFGSLMLTNIGSLGIDEAFCPIAPYTQIPMVVSMGLVKERPWVENHELKVKRTCKFCFTVDHRLMEAAQFRRFKKTFLNAFSEAMSLYSEQTANAQPSQQDCDKGGEHVRH
jgi:pyruvate/2-oxoglutarate dehydrogenase complex dihydrolipoamide acyltransferase (E2) component